MGYGDEIMASGLARGARLNGKKVAFGDGRRIIWGPWSEEIFRHNPNIAHPGDELRGDLQWCDFYKGNRHYNRAGNRRWIWNFDFKATPGEIYFGPGEETIRTNVGGGYVLIEPNVPQQKSVAVNKQWDPARWQQVAITLRRDGFDVVQLVYKSARYRLDGVRYIETSNFRNAMAVLSQAGMFLGHEGGMHHAAAALDVPGVVIFGGFIPPQVTGYDLHANLTGGDIVACGSLYKCEHCAQALDRITADQVISEARRIADAAG